MRGQAPIDHDRRSRDKRGFVGSHEKYRVGDLLGLANPADGILTELAPESLDVVTAQQLRHASIDGSRTYAVDSNSVLRVFQRRRPREIDHAGLGCIVGG